MKRVDTLCLIVGQDRILLGMKKRGFGAGLWNGFGGKVEPGESIEAAAQRELKEEAGVEASDMEEQGVLDFYFDDSSHIEVHVFRATSFAGVPSESEEMKPEWFDIDDMPFDNMWPDDRYWMPLFLSGDKFKGNARFGKEGEMLDYSFSKIDD